MQTLKYFYLVCRLIGLETALKWSKAQLGRGEETPRAPPKAEPRALHALNDNSPCTKVNIHGLTTSYPLATSLDLTQILIILDREVIGTQGKIYKM